ncbi:hypothetical protein [Salinimonas iocasae]|uniref:hypothetical protein n=1 Tax=Salinimonas iocasae TaxID=2572577 RepID=UPI00197F5B45|nr:hypothetical protein [Salinimonas iocasae]
MTKFDDRVKELVTKHPNLTKEDAMKIVTDKNARKRKERQNPKKAISVRMRR